MDFLKLENKQFLICGLGNRRSVGWAIGRTLEEAGAKVIYSVRNATRAEELSKLLVDLSRFMKPTGKTFFRQPRSARFPWSNWRVA
jgi:enoyl-[acyl-carrier protein] reductase I